MIAFVMPVAIALGGGVGLSQMKNFAKALGTFSMFINNIRLRKTVDLGVDEKTVNDIATNTVKSVINTVLKTKMEGKEGETFYVFEIDKEDVPGMEWLARKYCLVGTEYENFLDGVRHLYLMKRQGPEAERIEELLRGSKTQYDDLAFLWEGFGCDFKRLQELSDVRLNDTFLQACGIVPEGGYQKAA